MEKRSLIWTSYAEKEYHEILLYWLEFTQSSQYAERLENEVLIYERLLIENPEMGQEIIKEKQIRRVVILSNFSMFYRIVENTIEIVSFFDNRQDPIKIMNKINQ